MKHTAHMNYGVIGNGQSAALISDRGNIEWCCLPAFDSPSVFAQLLDQDIGGGFGLCIQGEEPRCEQSYLPHTNILRTQFSNSAGDSFEVLDFMPRYTDRNDTICPADIILHSRFNRRAKHKS